MTIVSENIASVLISTTTDFRRCPAGKRSAEITIKTTTGRSYCLDHEKVPPIRFMRPAVDDKIFGSWSFGECGRLIIHGQPAFLKLEDDSGLTISIPLGRGFDNLRYVEEIMRVANWCITPAPSQDLQIRKFAQSEENSDLALIITNNEFSDQASEQAQAASEAEKQSIYAEARNQSKSIVVRAALEYGKKMMDGYEALLEMVDTNVEDKEGSETILYRAIEFADTFCPNEASKLRVLQEELAVICEKIEQQIKSLSFA